MVRMTNRYGRHMGGRALRVMCSGPLGGAHDPAVMGGTRGGRLVVRMTRRSWVALGRMCGVPLGGAHDPDVMGALTGGL